MAVGFVFITLATIAGSTWAFIELGTSWISDPRISISFVTWGIYLAMVFLRVTAGGGGRKAAIMGNTALGFSAITCGGDTRKRVKKKQISYWSQVLQPKGAPRKTPGAWLFPRRSRPRA